MDPRQLFLRQHASVHSLAVAPAGFHLPEDLLAGLDDAALRDQPRGCNPIVWLLWHMARVEDAALLQGVLGHAQTLDDPAGDWPRRMGVARRDDGNGMSRHDVSSMARSCVVEGVMAYRDAVGRRTREAVGLMSELDLQRPVTREDIERGISRGALTPGDMQLVGSALEGSLWWWGVGHSNHHLGQIALVRRLREVAS